MFLMNMLVRNFILYHYEVFSHKIYLLDLPLLKKIVCKKYALNGDRLNVKKSNHLEWKNKIIMKDLNCFECFNCQENNEILNYVGIVHVSSIDIIDCMDVDVPRFKSINNSFAFRHVHSIKHSGYE